MATNGVHQEQYSASVATTTTETNQSSNSSSNLSKDEVGWYFVEQYYTTLSKSPDKLHLFYGKKSQFVYGQEAEVSPVSVGRQDIQDRIHKLDFQDCKVRISNVDSQASFDNIVIQVIGETSNKSEEPRKFVQTFVLAQQPSGYFVLNDILRYIKEEEEEATEAGPPAEPEVQAVETKAEPEPVPEPEAVKAEPVEVKAPLDAAVVDKKLEEVSAAPENLSSAPAIATPAEPATQTTAAAAPVETPAAPVPVLEKAEKEVVEEEAKKPEAPKEPVPTPAAAPAPAPAPAPRAAPAPTPAPAAPAAAEPEKPKGPPKPMTWASRAAAAAGPVRPIVPLPKTATPPAASRAAAPSPASTGASAPPAAAAKPAAESHASAAAPAAKESSSEWQTAGADSKRQNRPQSISGPAQDKETTLGYVKYVTEKVDEETLRRHLEKFGPVVYFDINRSKNCAFVEFTQPAGYQAAVAANPHTISGENILVEARRPKASAYGGSNYSSNRGNLSGRGRGGYEGRSGSQGGGRGGFSNQNRGRGGASARGRGASQVAA